MTTPRVARPVLIVVRDEWKHVAENWAALHAPTSSVVAMGKHMMFWDRAAEFNHLLDQFFQDL
ncbi:hypothetical protein [Aestuariivirga sp.]|uniref:hypothetical protein n=1 Tax=Aestuariivirga sp. TaxID=2650926 RepID=UPI00359481D8